MCICIQQPAKSFDREGSNYSMKPSGQPKRPSSLTTRDASKIQNQLEINHLISLQDTPNAQTDYQPGKKNNKQNKQFKKIVKRRKTMESTLAKNNKVDYVIQYWIQKRNAHINERKTLCTRKKASNRYNTIEQIL